jgi:hypothetical protein
MTKWERPFDAVNILVAYSTAFTERTPALRRLASEQMSPPSVTALYLSRRGEFEPFGHGLSRLNTLWASHNAL